MTYLVVLGQTVWASVGRPKNGGRWARPLRWSVSDSLEKRPSPTSVTAAKLVVLARSDGWCVLMEILR